MAFARCSTLPEPSSIRWRPTCWCADSRLSAYASSGKTPMPKRSAEFLAAHPKIAAVHYAGLPSHPEHAIARRQMRGFGGVVSFEFKGDLEATSRVVDGCRIPQIAPSLGGVESLIEQPALMSFYELSTEERLMVGIKDNLIRYSVGIEDTADLIADLAAALEQLSLSGRRLTLISLPNFAWRRREFCVSSISKRIDPIKLFSLSMWRLRINSRSDAITVSHFDLRPNNLRLFDQLC